MEDRAAVLEGVPVEIAFEVYDISNSTTAVEFENVEVFLWHADALGVYSAVEQLGTEGQMWLRGRQITNAEGKASFQTIMAGWYTSRAIHYHVRFRFLGEEDYAATTQLYVDGDFLAAYEDLEPYVSNNQQKTSLATDSVFTGIENEIADLLTLKMEGDIDSGFTTTFQIGLLPTDVSSSQNNFGGGGPLGVVVVALLPTVLHLTVVAARPVLRLMEVVVLQGKTAMAQHQQALPHLLPRDRLLYACCCNWETDETMEPVVECTCNSVKSHGANKPTLQTKQVHSALNRVMRVLTFRESIDNLFTIDLSQAGAS